MLCMSVHASCGQWACLSICHAVAFGIQHCLQQLIICTEQKLRRYFNTILTVCGMCSKAQCAPSLGPLSVPLQCVSQCAPSVCPFRVPLQSAPQCVPSVCPLMFLYLCCPSRLLPHKGVCQKKRLIVKEINNQSRQPALVCHRIAQMLQVSYLVPRSFPSFFDSLPSLVLQVCTPWQGAMAMIASFPHAPQALTRVVNALAEEAGEPCAASIQLAVRHFSIADEALYNMNSVQNSMYRNKLHGQPRRHVL